MVSGKVRSGKETYQLLCGKSATETGGCLVERTIQEPLCRFVMMLILLQDVLRRERR